MMKGCYSNRATVQQCWKYSWTPCTPRPWPQLQPVQKGNEHGGGTHTDCMYKKHSMSGRQQLHCTPWQGDLSSCQHIEQAKVSPSWTAVPNSLSNHINSCPGQDIHGCGGKSACSTCTFPALKFKCTCQVLHGSPAMQHCPVKNRAAVDSSVLQSLRGTQRGGLFVQMLCILAGLEFKSNLTRQVIIPHL